MESFYITEVGKVSLARRKTSLHNDVTAEYGMVQYRQIHYVMNKQILRDDVLLILSYIGEILV